MTVPRIRTIAPFGTWESPIDVAALSQQTSVFGEVATTLTDDSILYSVSSAEDHRNINLVKLNKKTSHTWSIPDTRRSSLYECGGGALGMFPNGDAVVAHEIEGRFCVSRSSQDQTEFIIEPSTRNRYIDFGVHSDGSFVLAIQEAYCHGKVVQSLACLCIDNRSVKILDSRHDFYAYPRFSPDGKWIAYVTWDHPNMPFWSAQLWVASVNYGASPSISEPILVGDENKVAQQPVWAPTTDAILFYTSSGPDGSAIHEAAFNRETGITKDEPIFNPKLENEVQPPLWVLNTSSLVALDNRYVVYVETAEATDILVLLDRKTKNSTRIITRFTQYSQLRVEYKGWDLVALASSCRDLPTIIRIRLQGLLPVQSQSVEATTEYLDVSNCPKIIPQEYISIPEHITFPTKQPDGSKAYAHAFFYAPVNPEFQAPAGTLPPCRIVVHEKPTSHATSSLDLAIQFWTTRGWAVCAVNFGGSTGYGYEYMRRINNHWGIMDVQDCVAAAAFLGGVPVSSMDRRQVTRVSTISFPFQLSEFRCDQGSQRVTLTRSNVSFFEEGALSILLSALFFLALFGLGIRLSTLLFLLPCSVLCCFFLRAFLFVHAGTFFPNLESISVIPHVGVQLETHRGMPLPWRRRPIFERTECSFIPRDSILDFFMLEAIQWFKIMDYAAIITRTPGHPESETVRVVFPNLLPPPPVYTEVYRKLHNALLHPNAISQKARIDPSKVCISGRSSGGFTVLRALCEYPNMFCAGYSAFGICDLALFEEALQHSAPHYASQLLGGTVEEIPAIYSERSPLISAHQITTPILLTQGNADELVVPEQSRALAQTIRNNGGSVEYYELPGEGHGFCRPEHQAKVLCAEEAHMAKAVGLVSASAV